MLAAIKILRAESRLYKKDGKDEWFNTVSALFENELVELQATKDQVDYIKQNKDSLHNVEIQAELKPKGYILDHLVV